MQTIKVTDPSQYAYVFGPYLEPIAKVKPGESVVLET